MKPADHLQIPPPRIGVLLVNLGTPEAAEPKAVKRYLGEFLSDRRVVEIPRLLWQPILRGIILQTRPKKSSEAYEQVWMEEGSPLAHYTKRQAEELAARFGAEVDIRWAMRYGEPAVGEVLTQMKADGCERILVAPLYPQYCAATTATVMDECYRALAAMRWQPALRSLPPYHDDPAYIDALKTSIGGALETLDFSPDALLLSFHGMPQRTLELGDPYHCHCRKTARLLGEAMGRDVRVAFQSRFGRAKWLEPATDAVLEAMPGEGIKRVAIAAPGFASDCLETLEELAIRGQEQFFEAGGERFAYLPCLNDSAPGIAMLETLLRRELMGWTR
ncbi:ferrochelatase [Novosphingopyxis iocasae]|uniref:ferrochelatase n=1 Tax=Novosphingopyxis iocasae TaxID=2762729 RepID=UPI00165129D4|nr:ferrochelatase [Novosphingopyxis iocasae]